MYELNTSMIFFSECEHGTYRKHTLQVFMFFFVLMLSVTHKKCNCNYVYDRVIVIHITVPFLPFIVLQIK